MSDFQLSPFALGAIVLGSVCIGCIVGAIGITALAGATLRDVRDIFFGDEGR